MDAAIPRGDAAASDARAAAEDATTDVDADPCVYDYGSGDPGSIDVLRVSLEVFCGQRCPASLEAFDRRYTCDRITEDDGGVDDVGAFFDGGVKARWERREGCGSVEFHTVGSMPEYFNFDARSGALIGAGWLSDLIEPIPRTHCSAGGVAAGEAFAACDDVAHSACF